MDSIRVLLVDDHLLIRKSFKHLIQKIPKLVVIGECKDGNEVIPFLGYNPVDVIFMDIMMKHMDGFEATKKVKERYPEIKVIGFSSSDHTDFTTKIMRCGADGFLSKFDADKDSVILVLKKIGFTIS
jgi:DNA-binding NarL/FixJ family response regulator